MATNQVESALAPYGGAILSNEEVDFLGLHVDHRTEWGRLNPARNLILRYLDDVYHAHLLGSPDIEPEAFRSIKYLGDFQLVGLLVNTLTDEHCRFIGEIKTEELALNSPFITETGIGYLAKNKGLKVFSPGNINLTPESASALGGFKNLRGLHLSLATTTPEAFSKIPARLKLIALTLPWGCDNRYIDTIARWQGLKNLIMRDPDMNNDDLERLASFLPAGCVIKLEFTKGGPLHIDSGSRFEQITAIAEAHGVEIVIETRD